MANLKELKSRIASVTSTQQITRAMKMVAAVKLKRATHALMQARLYRDKLNGILDSFYSHVEQLPSSYFQRRVSSRILIIVVASNRGLAGSFNTNVVKAANTLIVQKYPPTSTISILAIGNKAQEFYQRKQYPIVGDHTAIYERLNFENSSKIAVNFIQGFLNQDYHSVEIVYTYFQNAAVQVVKQEQLLPIPVVHPKLVNMTVPRDYIFEPDKHIALERLLPEYIKTRLYTAILDSYASEQGARMLAMEQATENANELLRNLKLSYNQVRQAVITTELSEIAGTALTLA